MCLCVAKELIIDRKGSNDDFRYQRARHFVHGCTRLAYVLYDEFKQPLGACRAFMSNLLLFHQMLLKTKLTTEYEASHLSDSDDKAALMICLDGCKELL